MNPLPAFILWLLAATLASADATDWRKSLAPGGPGSYPMIAPVQLDYSFSWNGALAAGQITWQFGDKAAKPGKLPCSAKGRSLGAVAALYPFSLDAHAVLHATTLRPFYFHSEESNRTTISTLQVDYTKRGASSRKVVRPKATGKEHVDTHSFVFAPLYDMFAAMLFVRSQPLRDGDSVTFVAHPFESPHLCRVSVLGREKFNGNDAIKLDITLREITPEFTLLPTRKIKAATLWLSDDADRVALELRAKIVIGDIRMTLVNMHKL